MNVKVSNMKLVAQDKTMSCWFASGQMLIYWRQRKTQSSELKHPDPALVAKWGKKYDDNKGITNDDIKAFADDMGFNIMPPMTPSPSYMSRLLSCNGPLWVNGRSHITVIAGIRDTNKKTEVLVFDPALQTATSGKWHEFFQHYGLKGNTRMDAGKSSITSMLFLPT